MRQILPIVAALAAIACQPSKSANTGTARPDAAADVAANETSSDAQATGPDAPVSSDDPAAPPATEPGTGSPDCPIVRSSDWHAHVDAMPGPNNNPRLIVSGKVTVPSGGYKLGLRMGRVAESYPVQVTVHLDAIPPKGPATQALETHEVRGSWPSEQRVGSVTVRCGSKSIAQLSNIETAL
jgi:hypothetical protein